MKIVKAALMAAMLALPTMCGTTAPAYAQDTCVTAEEVATASAPPMLHILTGTEADGYEIEVFLFPDVAQSPEGKRSVAMVFDEGCLVREADTLVAEKIDIQLWAMAGELRLEPVNKN